jgi:hypothetical protein
MRSAVAPEARARRLGAGHPGTEAGETGGGRGGHPDGGRIQRPRIGRPGGCGLSATPRCVNLTSGRSSRHELGDRLGIAAALTPPGVRRVKLVANRGMNHAIIRCYS